MYGSYFSIGTLAAIGSVVVAIVGLEKTELINVKIIEKNYEN
jgi:hypothetical protein